LIKITLLEQLLSKKLFIIITRYSLKKVTCYLTSKDNGVTSNVTFFRITIWKWFYNFSQVKITPELKQLFLKSNSLLLLRVIEKK